MVEKFVDVQKIFREKISIIHHQDFFSHQAQIIFSRRRRKQFFISASVLKRCQQKKLMEKNFKLRGKSTFFWKICFIRWKKMSSHSRITLRHGTFQINRQGRLSISPPLKQVKKPLFFTKTFFPLSTNNLTYQVGQYEPSSPFTNDLFACGIWGAVVIARVVKHWSNDLLYEFGVNLIEKYFLLLILAGSIGDTDNILRPVGVGFDTFILPL